MLVGLLRLFIFAVSACFGAWRGQCWLSFETCLKTDVLSRIFLMFVLYEIIKLDAKVFLDASSHLYKRVCPSVRPSVGPSVGP